MTTDKQITGLWTFVRSFRPIKPERLCTFIVAQGGVSDRGGNVRKLIGSTRSRPGLIAHRGRSLDRMAELCCEQGFIEAATERALLDAIDLDLTSEGVYRLCDLDAYQEWREWMMYYYSLDKLGLMHLQSVAQVLRALATMGPIDDEALQSQPVESQDVAEVPESVPF
ncbi:MAG: hypothetical protein E6R03_01030 [Hyphomicrobiaceae bacterium]|nr:MAG: hypothetical protein E6R03_01030 [Hyphomicrobiaceae bacterium]